MPYLNRFIATDNLIADLNPIISTVTNSATQGNYAGFLSVSAVTVYELAIKDIFNEFAARKHRVFASFVQSHFDRINGRIKIDSLKKEHIPHFGDKYLKKFKKILDERESSLFTSSRISIKSNYGNLITCRHEFVHQGNPTLSIAEVINCYQTGKEVIHCLNMTMQR